jgi:DNA-binding transcriptional LysR family regulator
MAAKMGGGAISTNGTFCWDSAGNLLDVRGYMDLRQLEHFVTVATEQNFTRAAGQLHLVQSGLSASIRALEQELGAALFIRTTRRVDLTSTGRAFLVEARRVLAAAAGARQVVEQMQGLQCGTLSIGVIQALAPLVDIADLLSRFRLNCPNVEIRLVSGGSVSLIEGVRTGELDLAFINFVRPIPHGVTAWMLACEPLVAVCAPDHWLAGRHGVPGQDGVTLGDLVDETFVDVHPDWGTRQLVDRSFTDQRLARRIGFEVNDLSTQLDLVAHGLGIALVPSAVVAHWGGGRQGKGVVSVAALAEPEICWELAVVFAHDEKRQPNSAAARMFLELVRSCVEVLNDVDMGVGAGG